MWLIELNSLERFHFLVYNNYSSKIPVSESLGTEDINENKGKLS